jgi:dihydrofolate synthase/folylpolyglutamate synthase
MNYKACVEYLYTKLPMFLKTGPASMKMDLANTYAICSFLGDPQNKFKTIHIAGTNGKGSVSHLLSSILQEAGYKTGLYTSPHLEDFRERIRINGEMIPEKEVIAFTEKINPLIEEIEPSFFEVTVGMAFDYFAKEKVDIAVIETGLGGRLDSTNVIYPELSIITNISYDHVQILGNTLEKIASEKAGIIKKETAVVIGKAQLETKTVFQEKAIAMDAHLIYADQQWSTKILEQNPSKLTIEITSLINQSQYIYTCPLAGSYQQENIRTVRTAVDQLNLKGWSLDEIAIKKGITNVIDNTSLHGRWETISTSPLIILDVAHNADGMQKMIEQLNRFKFENIYIVIGMSSDKDVNEVLALLPKHANYAFTKANLPRAMDPGELKKMAENYGLKGDVYLNVNEALSTFKERAKEGDIVLVCGSIFVVGEVDRKRLT